MCTRAGAKGTHGAGVKVVYVSSCIAAKFEVSAAETAGAIDIVLTYRELEGMLRNRGLGLATLPEEPFDGVRPHLGRIHPISEGTFKAFSIVTDPLDTEIVTAEGEFNVMEIIRDLELKRHGFAMLPRSPSSFTPFPDGRYLLLGPDKEIKEGDRVERLTEHAPLARDHPDDLEPLAAKPHFFADGVGRLEQLVGDLVTDGFLRFLGAALHNVRQVEDTQRLPTCERGDDGQPDPHVRSRRCHDAAGVEQALAGGAQFGQIRIELAQRLDDGGPRRL